MPKVSGYKYPALEEEISTALKLSEPAAAWVSGPQSITIEAFFSNKFWVMSVIKHGVPFSLFSTIKSLLPFTEEAWAGILDLSTKSLQRYKQTMKNFKPIQSEKIIEMVEVTYLGTEVFGTVAKFKLWLETPNYSLGNSIPLHLLETSYGKELVTAELTRINHGVFV